MTSELVIRMDLHCHDLNLGLVTKAKAYKGVGQ